MISRPRHLGQYPTLCWRWRTCHILGYRSSLTASDPRKHSRSQLKHLMPGCIPRSQLQRSEYYAFLIHYKYVVNHHSQASRPSHSFSDRSMVWHTHQARMRRKRSISPSIGSNHQRLVHKMKYWACWFTRLCIVISTMQKIHVQGVLSRVLQVCTFWYRLLSLNFVFRTTGRFREASRWVCTTALET